MKEYIPYTYLIDWSSKNLWYYGSETAQIVKIANPKNLWVSYFTSSEYVKNLRSTIGEPDVISIRKTFKTKIEAINWEKKVLKRLKIRLKPTKWINRNVGGAIIFTDEILEKMSLIKKNKKATDYQLVNLSKGRSLKPLSGKIHITNGSINKTIFQNELIPEGWKRGRSITFTDSGISKLKNNMIGKTPYNKGVPMKLDQKIKISLKKKGVSNPSAIGNKNVVGTVWINNTKINKRVPQNLPIPDGWKQGRLSWSKV